LARLILILVIIFCIVLLVRGFMRKQVKKTEAEDALAKSKEGEDMVTCAKCGVNLPRSEARESAGQLVCNENPRCRGPE
jgi:formylmethanofuran dehydrogenase subunit E